MNTRVLVTGYGGFLGAAICRQLISQGYCVRGLARGTYRHLEQLGVETIRGSITDPKDVSAAMDRVDAVSIPLRSQGYGVRELPSSQ